MRSRRKPQPAPREAKPPVTRPGAPPISLNPPFTCDYGIKKLRLVSDLPFVHEIVDRARPFLFDRVKDVVRCGSCQSPESLGPPAAVDLRRLFQLFRNLAENVNSSQIVIGRLIVRWVNISAVRVL
jgi:hypothetical protein